MKVEGETFWKAEVIPCGDKGYEGLPVTGLASAGESLYLAGTETDNVAAVHRLHVGNGTYRLKGKWRFKAPNPQAIPRTQKVTGLCVNDADSVLAVVCDDGWLYVERTHAEAGRHLRAHRFGDRLRAVAMEPGYGSAILRAGSRLVVGGERGELALYGESWLGLSQIAVLHRGREAITAIAWHVEFIAWSSQDGTVRVYDSERNRGLCAVQPPGTSERMPVSAPSNEQRSLNRPDDTILMDTQLHWTKDDHLCISWRFMSSNEAPTATSIDTSACIAIRLLSFQTYRQSASSDAQVQTLWSCCEPLWRNGYKRTWAVPCQWDGLHVLLFACQMGSDDTTAHGTRPASKDCVASSRVTSNSSEHETLLMSLEVYDQEQVAPESEQRESRFALVSEQRLSVHVRDIEPADALAVWLVESSTMLIVLQRNCSRIKKDCADVPLVVIRIRPCSTAELIRWLCSERHDWSRALALAQKALKSNSEVVSSEEMVHIADSFLEEQWLTGNAPDALKSQLDEIAANIPAALEGWQAPDWLWEKWIQRLLDVGRANILVSVIPTQSPTLNRQIYDSLFRQMIETPAAGMLYAAQNWPLEIFSVDELIEALEGRLEEVRRQHDASRPILFLTESLSALYTRSGRTEKTLFLILEQDGRGVFSYIRKHRMFAAARHCIHALFILDAVEAARTLAMADPKELDVGTILDAIGAAEPQHAMLYLEEVFCQAPENLRVPADHERLLELLAKWAPARVVSFLEAEDCACRTIVAMRILTEAATPENPFSIERALLHFQQGDHFKAYELLIAEQAEATCIHLARKRADPNHWVFLATRMRDPQQLLLIADSGLSVSQILGIIHKRRLEGELIHLEARAVHEAYQRLEEQQQCAQGAAQLLRQRLGQLERTYASTLFDGLLIPPPIANELHRLTSLFQEASGPRR